MLTFCIHAWLGEWYDITDPLDRATKHTHLLHGDGRTSITIASRKTKRCTFYTHTRDGVFSNDYVIVATWRTEGDNYYKYMISSTSGKELILSRTPSPSKEEYALLLDYIDSSYHT